MRLSPFTVLALPSRGRVERVLLSALGEGKRKAIANAVRSGSVAVGHVWFPRHYVRMPGSMLAARLPNMAVPTTDELYSDLCFLGIADDITGSELWELRMNRGIETLRVWQWGGLGDGLLTVPALVHLRNLVPSLQIEVVAISEDAAALMAASGVVDVVSLRTGVNRKSNRVMDYYPDYGLLSPSRTDVTHTATLIGRGLGVEPTDVVPRLAVPRLDARIRDAVEVDEHYITVHPWSGLPQKVWPLENWEALVRKCPLPVIQVGGMHDPRVRGALDARGLHMSRFLRVLANSEALVAIDSMVQHAAAGLAVPRVVLWGPTSPRAFGYPCAANISAGCECRCYVERWTRCNRQCMARITVEEVVARLPEGVRLPGKEERWSQ